MVFELKNPYSDQPTVEDAYNQIQHYRYEIPQLFDYNALVVVSDGVTTLHGMWPASDEWYAPWKSIDGFHVEANTTGSMKTLVEGLFPQRPAARLHPKLHRLRGRQRQDHEEGRQVPPVLRRAAGGPQDHRDATPPAATNASA